MVAAAFACSVALASCGGGGDGESAGEPPVVPAPGVDGPAWWRFGRDAQHRRKARSPRRTSTASPGRRRSTSCRHARPSGALLTHYGSPVVTSHNTVVVPVKTGPHRRLSHRGALGRNGGLIWSADTDYVLPPHNWVPSYNLALTTGNRLYAPGAGGKLLVKDDADAAGGALQHASCSTAPPPTTPAPAAFDASVFINTPLTVDAQGNVFFGFVVTGANPAGLVSGIARVDAERRRQLVSAALHRRRRGDRQAGDEQRAGALARRPARSTSR